MIDNCPHCGEPTVQPRGLPEYCEECGWPDENRPPAPESVDEFVFIDRGNRPFFVSNKSGDYWLYYWHEGQKNFVTLRKILRTEALIFSALKLPQEQAHFYLHP